MNAKGALRFIVTFAVFNHECNKQTSYAYFCELNFATLTANQATGNLIVFLYERVLGEKQSSIKIEITNNDERFWNMKDASCNLQNGQENGERYIVELYFWNDIKFRASGGGASWRYSIDGRG